MHACAPQCGSSLTLYRAVHAAQRDDLVSCVEEYEAISLWSTERDREGNYMLHLPAELLA